MIKQTPVRLDAIKLPTKLAVIPAGSDATYLFQGSSNASKLDRSVSTNECTTDVQEVFRAVLVGLAYKGVQENCQISIASTWPRNPLCRLPSVASAVGPPKPELDRLAFIDSVGQPVSAMYVFGLLLAVAAMSCLVSESHDVTVNVRR